MSSTLPNSVTAPVRPSILQIDPGPPSAHRAKPARHESSVRRAAARAIRHSVAIGVGHHDRQPVGGRGGGVNIRQVRVVERQGKDLAGLARNRKILERAKGLLMKRYQWSEADAFRRLQRGAMNQRMAIVQLAQAILNGEDVNLGRVEGPRKGPH